jgi:type VI secretion system protein ImpA
MPLPEGLLAPISEEQPGGTDITYEAEYSRIVALRDTRSPDHDFEELVDLATSILENKSKDLTLAIWLTEALLNLEGFEGLHSGLTVIHGFLDQFWEHLYPEEMEDRAFALEFVGEGFTSREDKYEPIKFVAVTDWGHTVHDFEEWKGLRKDSFAGAEAGKQGKKKDEGNDDDPHAPTASNFETGFAETPKARYKTWRAEVGSCAEAVEALEGLVKERFKDLKGPKPSFGKLKEVLGRATTAVQVLLDKKLELEPDPIAEAPQAAADPSGAPAESSSSSAGKGNAPGLSPDPVDTADAHRRIASAARFLRREDPTDPASYLLLRGLRWGELRKGGGALDVRLLDAPPTELRKRLKTLLLDGSWPELVDAAEEVMATPSGRGWLDLQRYLLTALDALGSTYRAAADAVKGELAALLRDVPKLLSAALMDDTPTANAETLEWLQLSGLTGGDGENPSRTNAPDYDQERVLSEATHEKALEWAASGNPMRGVELLKKRAEREGSARARFITESLAASVLVDAGMVSVARPLLEDLVDLAKKRNLEDWEAAEIVARPIGLLYRCLPASDRRRSQLYDELSRLDPVMAVSLERAAAAGGTTPSSAKPETRDEPADQAQDRASVDPGSTGE